MSVPAVPSRTCENCDHPDVELVAVHRVYVVPESWDQEGSETTMPEVEQWCYACLANYPHDLAAPPS